MARVDDSRRAPACQQAAARIANLPRAAAHRYNVGAGLPPNSLRTVTVDGIRCERVAPAPGLTVRHVRAQKRWLRPGEAQSFQTALENFSATPATRTLVLVLERGLGETQELARQEITLAPGESKALTIPWQIATNTAPFGWEIRAESRAGSTVESAARDFFSVHPQAYFVQIAGGNHRRLDPFRDKESPQNLMEVFAATPGDCAQILPQTDAWVCGMSPVAQSFPIVRAAPSGSAGIRMRPINFTISAPPRARRCRNTTSPKARSRCRKSRMSRSA